MTTSNHNKRRLCVWFARTHTTDYHQHTIQPCQQVTTACSALKPTISYSGHGALREHPQKRLDEARRRYEKWAQYPEKIGWRSVM